MFETKLDYLSRIRNSRNRLWVIIRMRHFVWKNGFKENNISWYKNSMCIKIIKLKSFVSRRISNEQKISCSWIKFIVLDMSVICKTKRSKHSKFIINRKSVKHYLKCSSLIKWVAVRIHSPQNFLGSPAWNLKALAIPRRLLCFLSTLPFCWGTYGALFSCKIPLLANSFLHNSLTISVPLYVLNYSFNLLIKLCLYHRQEFFNNLLYLHLVM